MRSISDDIGIALGAVVGAAIVWSIVFVLPVMAIRGDWDHVGGLTWVRLSFLAPLGFGAGVFFGLRLPR